MPNDAKWLNISNVLNKQQHTSLDTRFGFHFNKVNGKRFMVRKVENKFNRKKNTHTCTKLNEKQWLPVYKEEDDAKEEIENHSIKVYWCHKYIVNKSININVTSITLAGEVWD